VGRARPMFDMGDSLAAAQSFRMAQEFVERAKALDTLQDLAGLLEATAKDMSFDYYALIHHVDHRLSVNGAASVRLENYPRPWVERFLAQQLYSWDPIHIASYATNLAFAWSDVPEMINLSRKHKAVLASAADEGLGDGITVPANLPGEANGSCSFAVRTGKSLPREHMGTVQLIGAFAFQMARNLALEATRSIKTHERISLSPRQLDCILLAGRGKSDWEIATILGIKEDTVTEHMNTARERYGVARRMQLVLRVVHDGQIALSDLL